VTLEVFELVAVASGGSAGDVEVRPEVAQARRPLRPLQTLDAGRIELELAGKPLDDVIGRTLEVDPQERRSTEPVETPRPVVQLLDLVLPEQERLRHPPAPLRR